MPLAAAILLGLWLVILVTTRYSSLASITCAVVATPLAALMGYPWSSVIFTGSGAPPCWCSTAATCVRLVRGQELRIQLSRAAGVPNPLRAAERFWRLRRAGMRVWAPPGAGEILVPIDTTRGRRKRWRMHPTGRRGSGWQCLAADSGAAWRRARPRATTSRSSSASSS